MIVLELPFPPKELNPNKKMHWAAKAGFTKAYRSKCKAIAVPHAGEVPDGDLIFEVDFYPPDNRKRDDDNMPSAFKAGRDGIAEGLGVNDIRFDSRPRKREVCKPDGKVVVKIYKEI